MKNFFLSSLLFIAWGVLTACEQQSAIPEYRPFDNTRCSNQSQNMTINELPIIDHQNIDDYEFSGRCERDRSEVLVHVEGHPLSRQPICNKGSWRLQGVDLTAIVAHKDQVQIAVAQGSSQNSLCQQVANSFICPQNYVPVPKLEHPPKNFDNKSFCVMKFEAKMREGERFNRPFTPQQNPVGAFLSGPALPRNPQQYGNASPFSFGPKAVSLATGQLIIGMNEDVAKQYCENNGYGYTLISNDEWQTIARHIEATPTNWSEGIVDIKSGNYLNMGNTRTATTNTSNTDEELTQQWSPTRRIHQLVNGAYIWDFSGNLWEIVQHNISSLEETYSGPASTIPAKLRSLFGPQRDYGIFDSQDRIRGNQGGLGYIDAGIFKGGIVRGGGTNPNRVGVFSTKTTFERNTRRRIPNTGFRCVFHP